MKKEKLEEIIQHQKNIIEELETELESTNSKLSELSNRILKAIEYINKNMFKEINGCGLWWYQLPDYETPDKLLEILKGSDK